MKVVAGIRELHDRCQWLASPHRRCVLTGKDTLAGPRYGPDPP
jgi:hypothetical protein